MKSRELEFRLKLATQRAREIRHADKILVVCSQQYRQKVHAMEDGERITGTGWESMLVTSSIWANLSDRKKITAVLLSGAWQEAAPDVLIGLPYFDLSNMVTFEANCQELLRSLTGQKEPVPPLGPVPISWSMRKEVSSIIWPKCTTSTYEHLAPRAPCVRGAPPPFTPAGARRRGDEENNFAAGRGWTP